MALYEVLEDGTLRKVAGNTRNLTFDDIYPIGSVYITTTTTATGPDSPASLFGGRWERLPDGYALWTSSSGAGNTISAGLPNITGKFGQTVYAVSNKTSGAFTQVSGGYASVPNGSWAQLMDMQFDANNGADVKGIYGNSTTVQPPAYKVYAWKRVS